LIEEATPAAPAPLACHHCGALHVRTALPAHSVATCRLCGLFLAAARPHGIEHALALHLGAAVAWLVAHVFPLITISIQGQATTATLITGVRALFDAGLGPLAVACVLFVSVFPGLRILLGIAALLAAAGARPSPAARLAFKLVRLQGPWLMLEIYLLGIVVSYVKLMSYADIAIGPAALALVAAILLLSRADVALDGEAVWRRIGRPSPNKASPPGPRVACHDCGLVTAARAGRCPRCDAALHRRKRHSLQRTWALLIAALILYIPANTYPMMVVNQFGQSYPGTILGGVVDLVALGDWPVAAIIFIASVLVPILKFLALGWLLASVHFGSRLGLRRKTQLYAAVEWIGRYSMVDVFVVAILAGVVQVGGIFAIEPGVGALAFCGVVVLTMLAAMSFDPRLLWDAAGNADERV
jgi:paraquat-inducible protein A